MTAKIFLFPKHGRRSTCVNDAGGKRQSMDLRSITHRNVDAIRIVEQHDGDGWLVVAREHGWLHGDLSDAVDDAEQLSYSMKMPLEFCQ